MKPLLIAFGILAGVVGFAMSIDYHAVNANSFSEAAATSRLVKPVEKLPVADSSQPAFQRWDIKTSAM